MLHELVAKVKRTSSTKNKQEILTTANDIEKNLLQMTYDPLLVFNLSEIDYIRNLNCNSNLRRLDDPDKINETLSLLYDLNKRVITGNEAKDKVRSFINSLLDEDQDLFVKIINKDLKMGASVKLLNAAFGDDFIKEFEIQLANTYQDFQKKGKFKKVNTWYENAKLDGHRFFIASNGVAYSRNGKSFAGMDHILSEISVLRSELAKKRNILKDIFFDGELYSQDLDFNEIAGRINANKNFTAKEKEAIDYYIFVVGHDGIKNTGEMVKLLTSLNLDYNFKYLKMVPYTLIPNDPSIIKEKCQRYMALGYEGIMLRDSSQWYDWKRSDALLKYKMFKEDDFIIKDILRGTKSTKFENTLGSIECYGKLKLDDGKEVDVAFNANFKGTYQMRDRIWKDKEKLIGSVVEVKYQDVSQNADGRYSLRFPYATKIKIDR